MGEVPVPSLRPENVNTTHELALAIIPTIEGLATGHNSMCKDLKEFKTDVKKEFKEVKKEFKEVKAEIKGVNDVAKSADQHSKTNRWLISIIISVASLLFIGVIVAGITG